MIITVSNTELIPALDAIGTLTGIDFKGLQADLEGLTIIGTLNITKAMTAPLEAVKIQINLTA
ncbi:MAG TPA: hypothetical protein VKR58_06345 [Aquella sp.]|nr:hypothetical protein [Aquella sp.]